MPDFRAGWFVPLASGGACALAAWIATKTRGTGHLPGCAEGSGCAAISATRWARWLTVPVAIPAAVIYFALGLISVLEKLDPTPPLVSAYLALALFIGASSIWFVLLQTIVVRRLCFYCNLVHALGLAVCFATAAQFNFPDVHPIFQPSTIVPAGVLFGLLIIGQSFSPHKTYALIPSIPANTPVFSRSIPSSSPDDKPSGAPRCAKLTPSTQRPAQLSSREIVLRSGKLRLRISEWPILGSPDAENILALAFDYTCPVCRIVHKMLDQLVRQSPENLAVLLLPLPQHPACNRTVHKVCPGHAQACQYSRMALSLWTSRPDRFEEFDAFLSVDTDAPPVGLAMRRFEQLTGEPINPHGRDERLDAVIARAVDIYDAFKVKQIPNLLLSNAELPGQVESLEKLQSIIAREHKPQAREIAACNEA